MNKRYGARYAVLPMLSLILLCLTACQTAHAPAETAPTGAPTAAPLVMDAVAQPTDAPIQAEAPVQAEAHAAYRAALTNLLHGGVLPDGSASAADPAADLSENQFAIRDIDFDGRDELLLIYTTAPMAGQVQYICDYDGSTMLLRTQLTEYPLLTFFDNGVIRAGWSHNQGLAGAFWPYSLYQYDAAADSYPLVAMVDAWDKRFAETDPQGNPFPADIDAEGAGFVYYVMTNGIYETVAPIGQAAYDAWYQARVGGAAEIAVPYLALTEANIAAIG